MIDQETAQLLSESDHIRQTLDSEGWKLMAERLDTIIARITDIRSFTEIPKERFAEELERRLGSVSIVEEWLNAIKGEVMTSLEVAETEHSKQANSYIIRR